MKINFSELQLVAIDYCRKQAAEISRELEQLSWLFDIGSQEETELMKFCKKAEEIEIFCEEQKPF